MADRKGALALECPACGGELRFDPSIGKLKCIYCDSAFTTEEAEAYFAEKEKKTVNRSANADWGTEQSDMCAYACSNCGAELLADQNTAVIRCPYCGNNTVAAAQFAGAIRPDSIIPFSFTKEQAVAKYNEYYKRSWLVPKSFINNSKIEEIQGVYVPFWLYSGSASIDADYDANDVSTQGDTRITQYYSAHRSGVIKFENVPADASKRMPDDLMDSIEPYDFAACVNFSITYLPGFLAERFNVSDSDNKERTDTRIKNTTCEKTRSTVIHDNVSPKSENVKIEYNEPKYTLLPVWYFVSKWKDKDFSFAMNGQTGEFTGDLPASPFKLLIVGAIAFVITFLIVHLFSGIGFSIFIGIIITLVAMAIANAGLKPVAKATQARNYMRDQVVLSNSTDTYLKTTKEKIKRN